MQEKEAVDLNKRRIFMFESKGIKRTLASIFAFIAAIAPTIPPLAPYAQTATVIAGILGGVGVLHAGASKVVDK